MKLSEVITTYVDFQRSIGLRFCSTPRLLRRFNRAVGDVDIIDVTLDEVSTFLVDKGAVTSTWRLKFAVLSSFYRFAISRGYVESSPLPTEQPRLPPPFRPYIYSTDEITRLINATEILRSALHPLQVATYRTLLLLLYGTGMRISEALSLEFQDVDLVNRLLTVRDTKFFKYAACLTMSALCLSHSRCRGREQNPIGIVSPVSGELAWTGLGDGKVGLEEAITFSQCARGSAGRVPCAVRTSACRTGISVRVDSQMLTSRRRSQHVAQGSVTTCPASDSYDCAEVLALSVASSPT